MPPTAAKPRRDQAEQRLLAALRHFDHEPRPLSAISHAARLGRTQALAGLRRLVVAGLVECSPDEDDIHQYRLAP